MSPALAGRFPTTGPPGMSPKLMTFFNVFYFWLCWVFIAVEGLSQVAEGWGRSLGAACGLLTAAAPLCFEAHL